MVAHQFSKREKETFRNINPPMERWDNLVRDQSRAEAELAAAEASAAPAPEVATPKRIVTIVLLGAVAFLLAQWWWNSQTFDAEVNGDVYVVTKGQSTIKMTGVMVLVLDLEGLRIFIAECNDQLAGEFQAYKQRFDRATTRDSKLAVWSEWHRRQEQALASTLRLKVSIDASARAYRKPTQYGFYRTATDFEGRFSLTLPKSGTYMVLGFGERDIVGQTEHYCWVKHIEVARHHAYNIHLSNDSDRVIQTNPEFIRAESLSEDNFDEFMLARVMANEGFAPPALTAASGFW
ncbi:MAG: hypothetical protein ACLQU3_13325 [Limisphaerales bacterium]